MPGRTSTRQSCLARAAQQQQPGIQSFARAIKPGVLTRQSLVDGKKGPATTTTLPTKGSLPVSPAKKRKLHELQNVDCGGVQDRDQGSLTPSKSLRFSTLSVSTPRSGHYASTSVRSVRNEEEEEAKTTPRISSQKSQTLAAPVSVTRPACVEELLDLHLAFLKALTIHAAHRGAAAPADLREFLHSVERLWKKRKVVGKDLQRLIWVWGKGCATASSGFRLANHGLGRVCLERIGGRTEPVDEVELQTQFEKTVDLLWARALASAGGEESGVDFLATLGLASIHESLTPLTEFRKGQQRLQDLKGGVIKLKMDQLRAEAVDGDSAAPATKARDEPASRRLGLLDRIKNKQLRQAKLPPPPSKEMLLRRAAAERIEEVTGVLALLRPSGYVGSGPLARMAVQRTPFCLETIVQNVQDSTRNPISDKEVEACIEILSREDIAGHWVGIVNVNQLKSVVLKSCRDVQPKEIGAKVSQLKIGWEESASK
ncbi:hypothetical protein P175DRAFT_0486883 [Aspergillus ochraceoroseus IBT 24754]|uniref:DNA replication factor Cdt1 C-terminal domain-containing protein n=1 Tax=Aspergillus ochraceoroseus IBT 24754 TaxID=1392256 RepID=A0A2T5LMB1_9EURO|nr:uncharacterized protein P175DRAFT_0486883 [Aspergillus ochraceoroseus IBT 24754]PTU17422.1 hypothetical protein P175DRAFT_0486883 [Aspergillus ochraceoroseus IBT 24754]